MKPSPDNSNESSTPATVLIVDDQETNRVVLQDHVTLLGHRAVTATNGVEALEMLEKETPDIVLLDLLMPQMGGREVLQRMRQDDRHSQLPVVIISAIDDIKQIGELIEEGADDYMTKPFKPVLLRARIGACLNRKRLTDVERDHKQLLLEYNLELEDRVEEKVAEITSSHTALIFALSKLTESRDRDTGTHLERVREYCSTLSRSMSGHPSYRSVIDDEFIRTMYLACPLHDIGKVAIPDQILRKPGPLTSEEYEEMKRHTTLGADTLRAVEKNHPGNKFVKMGIEIAEFHHERWDGSGYPHGLSGAAIPVAARIVGLCDVYEALTSKRCYKEPFEHVDSVEIIRAGRDAHFDHDLVDTFLDCEAEFEQIRQRLHDK